MRPDPTDLVAFLCLGVAIVLTIPKVHWGTIAAHLRETAQGERVYAFRPPPRCGPLADDVAERWFQLARREWPRVIDLGVLLYVLAVVAEARGARRRRARDADWRDSASALILDHLARGEPESVLRERLRERDLREPAPKLTLPTASDFVLPPARWRIDWEREVAAAGPGALAAPISSPPRGDGVPQPEAQPVSAEFSVRTLGEFRVCHHGEDIAPRLLRRWILGYLFVYLLIREARRPGDRMLRGMVADELYPAQDQQADKVRKRLSELVGELPASVRGCIRMEAGYVGLDLSGYEFDVRELFALVRRVERGTVRLTEDTIAEVRAALAGAREEWLPGWEEIDRRATGGRGSAGELVAQLRIDVAAAHATLLRVLADWHLSRGEAQRVIPDLEDGLRRRPDQLLIATTLASAYEQAGQADLAARVRREHGLGESS